MGWIDTLLIECNRERWPIRFHPHAIMRQGERSIAPRIMEQAVRRGKLVIHKCGPPRKLCFEYYDGKTRMTYGTYVLVQDAYFEVMTAWKRRGRQ